MPSPCNELNSAADEINVDGTLERYPNVPKPLNDEKSAADEIKVEGTDDK